MKNDSTHIPINEGKCTGKWAASAPGTRLRPRGSPTNAVSIRCLSPDAPRNTVWRSKWKSHLACPLWGQPASWERCVSDTGLRSTLVRLRAARRALQMPPDPAGPYTHTHTHTHACKLRPLATGDREHSVIAQFFRRGSGRGTSPETLYWVAPEAVTACLALALVACGQEKCSEHLLLLEQHEIIPRPGVLPDLGELLKKPSGHPGASGRYCFAAQGQAPGGSSPQKPSKVNQPDGVSMGLHGACL